MKRTVWAILRMQVCAQSLGAIYLKQLALFLQRLQGNLSCYLDLCSALLSHIAALASAAAVAHQAAQQQLQQQQSQQQAQQPSHHLLEQQRLQQQQAAAGLPQLEAAFACGGLPVGSLNGAPNGVGMPHDMPNGSGALPNGVHAQPSPFARGHGGGGRSPVAVNGNGMANGHMLH